MGDDELGVIGGEDASGLAGSERTDEESRVVAVVDDTSYLVLGELNRWTGGSIFLGTA